MSGEPTQGKKKYDRISYHDRLKLIRLVQEKRETIKYAADCLNVKESTAKLIISRFRTTGTVYETKRDRRARLAEDRKRRAANKAQLTKTATDFSALVSSGAEDQIKNVPTPQAIIQSQQVPVFCPWGGFSSQFVGNWLFFPVGI